MCMVPRELRREGVSDQPRSAVFPLSQGELVARWKGLQQRGLARRDRAILFRVQKPPFRRIDAASGNRRSNVVPSHPTVHVAETFTLAVTPQLHTVGQPRTAPSIVRYPGDHVDDAAAALLRHVVQRVAAGTDVRESTYRV